MHVVVQIMDGEQVRVGHMLLVVSSDQVLPVDACCFTGNSHFIARIRAIIPNHPSLGEMVGMSFMLVGHK